MTQIMTRVASGKSVRVTLPLCRSGLGLGTAVMTTDGALPVEYLTPGDRIITFDAGAQTLERLNVLTLPMDDLVRIRPSVLDENGFGRNVVMSARQKLLVRDWRAPMLFGKRAALVEASRLADGDYITRMNGKAPMRVFQLHFKGSQHVIQLDQGLMVTSARKSKKASPSTV